MKHVLLTGASTGVGAAILEKLLLNKNDYEVSVIGRTAPANNGKFDFAAIDLGDMAAAEPDLGFFLSNRPPVDILINNAGVGYFSPVEEIPLEAWSRVISVNLTAAFFLISKVVSHMKSRDFGRIVNISSDADHIGFAGAGAYCASKFGMAGLAEAVRKELVGYNITLTTVSPGRIDTCFNGKLPGDRPRSLRASSIAALVLNIVDSTEPWHIENVCLKSPYE